jgi:hypothetical protein
MKKYSTGLIAIILAVLAVSFTVKNHPAPAASTGKPAIQTWYFNGSMLSQDLSSTEYGTSPAKSCNGTDDFPCEIQFDASQYTIPTTNTPLQNYLIAEGTDTQVLADAVSVRSN